MALPNVKPIRRYSPAEAPCMAIWAAGATTGGPNTLINQPNHRIWSDPHLSVTIATRSTYPQYSTPGGNGTPNSLGYTNPVTPPTVPSTPNANDLQAHAEFCAQSAANLLHWQGRLASAGGWGGPFWLDGIPLRDSKYLCPVFHPNDAVSRTTPYTMATKSPFGLPRWTGVNAHPGECSLYHAFGTAQRAQWVGFFASKLYALCGTMGLLPPARLCFDDEEFWSPLAAHSYDYVPQSEIDDGTAATLYGADFVPGTPPRLLGYALPGYARLTRWENHLTDARALTEIIYEKWTGSAWSPKTLADWWAEAENEDTGWFRFQALPFASNFPLSSLGIHTLANGQSASAWDQFLQLSSDAKLYALKKGCVEPWEAVFGAVEAWSNYGQHTCDTIQPYAPLCRRTPSFGAARLYPPDWGRGGSTPAAYDPVRAEKELTGALDAVASWHNMEVYLNAPDVTGATLGRAPYGAFVELIQEINRRARAQGAPMPFAHVYWEGDASYDWDLTYAAIKQGLASVSNAEPLRPSRRGNRITVRTTSAGAGPQARGR